MSFCYSGKRVQVSQLVRKEHVRRTKLHSCGFAPYTLYWRSGKFLFFSCMQLEYCLREPLSKFEGLSTFYSNFISVNINYCIAYMGHSTHSYYTYYRTYNKHFAVMHSYYKECGSLRSPTPCLCMHFICIYCMEGYCWSYSIA